jgi:hypothetical protein
MLLIKEAEWFVKHEVDKDICFNIAKAPNSRLGIPMSATTLEAIKKANTGRKKTELEKGRWREANLGMVRSKAFTEENKRIKRAQSSMTIEIAQEIRALAKTKEFNCYGGRKRLRSKFNISDSALHHILANRTWN